MIVSLYSHGLSPADMKPSNGARPQMIIIGGAPGVGKTTQARRFLMERGENYDTFYHVSFDAILESHAVYRERTGAAYRALMENRAPGPLTDEELGILSGVSASMQSSRELYGRTIRSLRKEALEYGVEQGWNIVYDTTFCTNVLERDILPLLHSYDITVLHVVAPEEQIKRQLEARHVQMIQEGWIRAMPIKKTREFMEECQRMFHSICQYVKINGLHICCEERVNDPL
uniref:Zeta toxin domain-containing protein n=1 Tax=viral metagenome TaxID=1070528 RepID=A0A6C0HL58_9ZZZZ